MKKILSLLLVTVLMLGLFTGCVGTTVVVGDCTCTVPPTTDSNSLKTGLAVTASAADSTNATAEASGAVKYDVTVAAVTVDDAGVIQSCVIDSIPATVEFDTAGVMTTDVTAAVPTKNELGEHYGMAAYGGAVAEWDEQVSAFCQYAAGKSVAELKTGAIDETGKAPVGSDLASSATIYLGGFVSLIEAAVNNAQHLGAQVGDTLKLATVNKLSGSTSALEYTEGCAQLDADITAVTERGGVITSCVIDSLQAKVTFDSAGAITTDVTVSIPTKNELGENYGMVAYGGASAEWNRQAAAFAAYVTGKTAEAVSGIAISETGKAADGSDLASSVTIAIGGFQALIRKALA